MWKHPRSSLEVLFVSVYKSLLLVIKINSIVRAVCIFNASQTELKRVRVREVEEFAGTFGMMITSGAGINHSLATEGCDCGADAPPGR